MLKRISAILCAAVLFVAALLGLQRLLEPKYMSKPYEGALTREYYKNNNAGNNDLIILGDCEAYENVSPATLWRNYGITSYIRGSAQQLVWQSYYLLEEALRYDKPKAVLFSVYAMVYDQPQSEAYNRMTIDGMRTNKSKFYAVQASKTADETTASYFFPLLRYHDRWKTLTKEDFRYFFKRNSVGLNGFMMRADVLPTGRVPTPPRLADYDFGENAWNYLDKMRALCELQHIRFVLFKSPSIYPAWYEEYDKQLVDYAEKYGLEYYNGLNPEVGIDMQTDTYDGGLHLNVFGAEKFAGWLGAKLNAKSPLPDRSGNETIAAQWNKKCAEYDKLKAKQEEEITQTGKVKTLIYNFSN
jgi:hypothetical protein